jgi:hypothetical protein
MTEPTVPVSSGTALEPMDSDEDRMWAAFAHLGGIVGPLPSLIIFLVLRHRGAKTAIESKEALNWQITFIAGWLIVEVLVSILGGVVVSAIAGVGSDPGNTLAILLAAVPGALWVVNIVFSALGFVKVYGGGSYRYPFAVRFIK